MHACMQILVLLHGHEQLTAMLSISAALHVTVADVTFRLIGGIHAGNTIGMMMD